MKLVIVESPTKAKTISKFLGKGFVVKSSFGHVRDLPKSEMGVDTEHNFIPRYVVPTRARKNATILRKDAEKADTIIFATDEDREGEAISWHLHEIFNKEIKTGLDDKELKRIVFHEITEEAIREALEHPRDIDMHLVDAQQARRILDRLVGYELSPLLWKKVARGLSAGRVQSVSLRFIVEREREIQIFTPREYWSIEGLFANTKDEAFEARIAKLDGKLLDKFAVSNEAEAKKILDTLANCSYAVTAVKKKTTHRSPAAPYTTSTLQQDANHKLGFSAKQTMMLAQQLYEGIELGSHGSVGLITYMRTDSVNLSDRFVDEARAMLAKQFGSQAIPESMRRYKARSRLAQEAHEAIRPTSALRDPASMKPHLDSNQYKLYDLIWRRALASQMKDVEMETTSVDILGAEHYTFRASGTHIVFEGFMALFPEIERPTTIPELTEGETVTAKHITPKQHFTEPPARFSDATLVKILEEHGIGRPSTYAPTISTLLDRNYVERIEGRKLKPTELAFIVTDLLVEHFPVIVDYDFTAKMEEELDNIAEGKKEWAPVIREFYEPFEKVVKQKMTELVKEETPTDEVCEKCQKPMVIKFGRFGKFLACTGFPECRNTKQIKDNGEIAEPETTDEKCPTCGADMEVKHGRYGAFLSCSKYPDCKTNKPILKSIGIKCEKCGKGDLVERRTKRHRRFWGCNQYPDCDFVVWKFPKAEDKKE